MGYPPFDKILNSKWTALEPANRERHFLVIRIADHKERTLKLECVVTKSVQIVAYVELAQSGRFRSGWH